MLAIAAGIVAGRKLGTSAVAALTARGFAELRRLGEALGGRPETLMGLSGLGDLMLTCSTSQSRNFSYGIAVGAGRDPAAPHPLVEGIETAAVTRDLARRHNVDMPVVEAVAAVLARRALGRRSDRKPDEPPAEARSGIGRRVGKAKRAHASSVSMGALTRGHASALPTLIWGSRCQAL